MLYRILKFPSSIAIYFYCRFIKINKKEYLKREGPLLIASNHPNSFLDAIILSSLFNKPIYSLARGDAFSSKFIGKLLSSLNMLPVYRLSEGAENLTHNFTTFSACQEIFKKGGVVLIFSEGRCVNEWHLRSLKKGTARLAITSWNENIPLEVLPLGINYNSFRSFGKNVHLNFGKIITSKDIQHEEPEGKKINAFNGLVFKQLQDLVYEIEPGDVSKRENIFKVHVSSFKKVILFLPAICGALIHYPLYLPIVSSIKNRANDHYDSIVVGLLFLLCPFYWIVIILVTFLITKTVFAFLMIALLPFSAWCYLQLKRQ